MSGSFRKQYFKAPWSVVHHFVMAMVPTAFDLSSVGAQMLEYALQSFMLLIEALAHASAGKTSSPPNQRLALVGVPIVESLLVQAIIADWRVAMHTARIADDDVEER